MDKTVLPSQIHVFFKVYYFKRNFRASLLKSDLSSPSFQQCGEVRVTDGKLGERTLQRDPPG